MSDDKKPLLPQPQPPEPLKNPLQLSEVYLQEKSLTKTERRHQKMQFAIVDTVEEQLAKADEHPLAGTSLMPLTKSAVNLTQDVKRGAQVHRITFEEDPTTVNIYQSLFKPKLFTTPDHILKTLGIRDSLVACILGTRSNHASAFGRELQDRFATGYRIEPRRGIMEDASAEEKETLQQRIAAASKALSSCGSTQGVNWDDRMSLATFMGQQTRNLLLLGRFCTEITYTRDPDGTRRFHSFRPADAATIYQAAPKHDAVDALRKQALHLLERLKGDYAGRLIPEKFENDEYAWVQVMDGRPRTAYTPEEMIVSTMFGTTDVDLHGYPLAPIDTCIDAVATHMNIVQHNKLYFQSGRAARGMIVIKSMEVDQGLVHQVRNHFNASINSVGNAWRVPVFGIDPEDSIEWAPLDQQGGRDMEFQYLSDQNAREICSAFFISPEELPGYQHLSRGTNSQALSEASNEYKLEAARDTGIRPMIQHFQDFLNDAILPLIDPMVAQLCVVKLYGLDADTAEKESTRIQQDMGIHMTMDEILERVEKDPVGKKFGGRLLLNPAWQQVIKENLYHGEIIAHFFDRPEAAQDPSLKYIQNPMWFQWQQLQMQAQQMQQQAQQQQQGGGDQEQGGDGDDQQNGDDQEGSSDGGSDSQQQQEPAPEITSGADQVIGMLKSERQLSPDKRKLLHHHDLIVKTAMKEWDKESQETLAEVLSAIKNE